MSKQQSSHSARIFRNEFNGLDAYSRHKMLVNNYVLFYSRHPSKTETEVKGKTEIEILKENHRFVRDPEDDEDLTWEKRIAKKYYDKLFKEYAIVELKYYREGKIALRWRTEKEVITGKGQFTCASTLCPNETNPPPTLRSWEVNFAYVEDDVKKNTLVKVRLCPVCSDKLNYKTNRRLAKEKKQKAKHERKEKSRKRRSRSQDNMRTKRKKERGEDDDEDESGSENEGEILNQDGKRQKLDPEEAKAAEASEIWSRPQKVQEEKSKTEEFDEYFAGLFD